MESKKYLPLKIIHLILLAAAEVLCIAAIVTSSGDKSASGSILGSLCHILEFLCLGTGITYFLRGYKKSAASYYKFFMYTFLVMVFVQTVRHMVELGSLNIFNACLYLIPLVMITTLAVAKDLGKTKSYIVAVILLISYIIPFAFAIPLAMEKDLIAAIGLLSSDIANILIAITSLLMVVGKYIDKTERGTN